MQVELFPGYESLVRIEAEWRAVWERDVSASLFQRPEYSRVWVPEFGGNRRIVSAEVRDGAALVGHAPLSIDPDGVLRFLGDPDLTDYFGPVSDSASRDAVADALLQGMRDLDGWRSAHLLGLAADSGWPEPLVRAAKAAGYVVEERTHDVCPRVAIPGGFEEYLEAIDAKQRHEIRRKARKLAREAGAFTVRLSDSDRLHADLESFFAMHRSSEGPKGHFLHWGIGGFFTLLARTFDREGWLRFALLEIDGRPVAGHFSFAARGVWSVYNSAIDQSMRSLSPGMVLTAETIRLAAEEGCHTYDLLRGDEPYKYRFGAVDVPLVEISIRPPGLRE